MFGAGQVLAPFLRESVADPALMSDLLVGRYTAPYVGDEGVSHLLQLARSLELDEDEQLQLGSVRAPVMIALGELDIAKKEEPAITMATELARTGASVVEEIIPGAGYLPAEDQPARLAETIRDWINVSAPERVSHTSQAGEASPES